jgi:hypothetical protein
MKKIECCEYGTWSLPLRGTMQSNPSGRLWIYLQILNKAIEAFKIVS